MSKTDTSLIPILLKKYQENTLASLYLISYMGESLSPEEWVQAFIKELTPLADHPDILKVYKEEKSNDYKVDSPSIKAFLHFINYRPLKLSKKFIFLFDTQDLSVIVSNKLLKVFEELESDYCLILLAPHDAAILSTVSSRAIKLKISSPESKTIATPDFTHVRTPHELIAHLKESKEGSDFEEKKFIESKIKECLQSSHFSPTPESFKALNDLLESLKDYETSNAYNNAKLPRLSSFFP